MLRATALVYLFALLSVLYLFLCGLFVSFLDALYASLLSLSLSVFFKKSTRLKPAHAEEQEYRERGRERGGSTAEIFRFAQIEIQSALRPPQPDPDPEPEPFFLPAAHLLISVRICGKVLTELLAFAVFW